MACDLAIPPLPLLVVAWLAAFACAVAGILAGAPPLPALLLGGGGLLLAVSILAVWAKFCRRQVPWTTLLAVPVYAWRKLPIYVGLLLRRQRAWVRTKREGLGTGD